MDKFSEVMQGQIKGAREQSAASNQKTADDLAAKIDSFKAEQNKHQAVLQQSIQGFSSNLKNSNSTDSTTNTLSNRFTEQKLNAVPTI